MSIGSVGFVFQTTLGITSCGVFDFIVTNGRTRLVNYVVEHHNVGHVDSMDIDDVKPLVVAHQAGIPTRWTERMEAPNDRRLIAMRYVIRPIENDGAIESLSTNASLDESEIQTVMMFPLMPELLNLFREMEHHLKL